MFVYVSYLQYKIWIFDVVGPMLQIYRHLHCGCIYICFISNFYLIFWIIRKQSTKTYTITLQKVEDKREILKYTLQSDWCIDGIKSALTQKLLSLVAIQNVNLIVDCVVVFDCYRIQMHICI